MGMYVMLSTLSESGRKVLRGRPGWIRKVNADVQRMGARVVAQYAVLGPYDFVTIIQAPANVTIPGVSVGLGAGGGMPRGRSRWSGCGGRGGRGEGGRGKRRRGWPFSDSPQKSARGACAA